MERRMAYALVMAAFASGSGPDIGAASCQSSGQSKQSRHTERTSRSAEQTIWIPNARCDMLQAGRRSRLEIACCKHRVPIHDIRKGAPDVGVRAFNRKRSDMARCRWNWIPCRELDPSIRHV